MTTLRASWAGTTRTVQVVSDYGEVIATITPAKGNMIHIASMQFADDALCPSPAETGLPGYLIKFKE